MSLLNILKIYKSYFYLFIFFFVYLTSAPNILFSKKIVEILGDLYFIISTKVEIKLLVKLYLPYLENY
jgi:hypothetical protein